MNTQSPHDFERIRQLLVSCAEQMFPELARGAGRTPCDDCPHGGNCVVAVIGYVGDGVKGSLALQATRAAAVALQPADLRGEIPLTDDLLRDQLGELANQLLGRLKNRLLGAGVVLHLATPTTACGGHLRLGSPRSGQSCRESFVGPAGAVVVRFDATFAPDFVLGEIAPDAAPALAEGESLFFG